MLEKKPRGKRYDVAYGPLGVRVVTLQWQDCRGALAKHSLNVEQWQHVEHETKELCQQQQIAGFRLHGREKGACFVSRICVALYSYCSITVWIG